MLRSPTTVFYIYPYPDQHSKHKRRNNQTHQFICSHRLQSKFLLLYKKLIYEYVSGQQDKEFHRETE